MFELIDRRCQYERLRKMGFLQYDKMISYKYILKKDISSAYNVYRPLLDMWDIVSLWKILQKADFYFVH